MGNPHRRRLFGFVVFVVLMTAFGGLGFAQEEPEAEQPAVEEEAYPLPISVGEITVTARKVEEDIQKVPVSVSTLQGEDLDVLTTGGVDVRALSGRVPSLVMESSFGRAFPRFYIRGLGNADFDLNASQPVSMVVDEVVLENPIVKGMPLFDLDRVEVLRGPQGTLFGRNTPAGIVKFETVKPSQEFEAYARASYGTYSTTDVQAAVGGSLGGDWSARFSGLYQSRSDWVDNMYEPGPENELGGYTTTAFRLQLLWEPGDRFSGLLKLHGWDVDGTARIFRANIFEQGQSGLISGFQQDQVWHDGMNSQDIETRGGLLRLEYDFGGATLTSITGYETLEMYSRGDIDGGYGAAFLPDFGPGFIPFASESADGLPELDQLTQEIRIASNGGGDLNWLVGVFYFDESLQVDSFAYDSLSPGNPLDGYAYQKQDAKSYALFGSLNYQVSDKWNLAGGLRWSKDEKDFEAQRVQAPFVQWLFYGSLPSVVITESVDDSDVSGDISAVYAVNDNFNVYGRLGTGYRAPSIQGRTLWCPDIDGSDPETNCVTIGDTETIVSFEAGIKTILAENRVRFNLTGYVFEMSDQQVTAVGGAANVATLINIDKTEGYGLEADMQWTPTAHWLTTFGFSWNPTEIVDPDLTVAGCGGGCTTLDPTSPAPPPTNFVAHVNGNPLPHAPDIVFNGIINFRSDAVDKGFFGTLDWAYYSEKNFFMYESAEFKDDSLEFGLRLGYGWNQGKYEVALFSRNLTDAKIARGGIDFNNLTGFTNDPRIIGIEFFGRF